MWQIRINSENLRRENKRIIELKERPRIEETINLEGEFWNKKVFTNIKKAKPQDRGVANRLREIIWKLIKKVIKALKCNNRQRKNNIS